MADNYIQFSEQINDLTPEIAEWVKEVLLFDMTDCNVQDYDDARKALADKLSCSLDEVSGIEYWPHFDWELEGADKNSLWLTDNGEGFDLENLMLFVKYLINKWMPDYIFSVTWAETCSKPRVGEFGGGWAVMTKDDCLMGNAHQAVKETVSHILKERSSNVNSNQIKLPLEAY